MYEPQIVADSIGPNGVRLTTATIVTWKPLIGEFNTHRVLTRNSASSRAIPIKRLRGQVVDRPFVPKFKHAAKGMQPGEFLSDEDQKRAADTWLKLREWAVEGADIMDNIGVAKQWVNRMMELWMETTVLVTATEWDNFFNLRCHHMAQDEIRHTAEAMQKALSESTPQMLQPGEWHIPYNVLHTAEALKLSGFPDEKMDKALMISAGRCATVSYDNLGQGVDPIKDLNRAKDLLGSGHMSPFEHQAQCLPMTRMELRFGQLKGGMAPIDEDYQECRTDTVFWGNLRGWYQFRKSLPNEAVFQG